MVVQAIVLSKRRKTLENRYNEMGGQRDNVVKMRCTFGSSHKYLTILATMAVAVTKYIFINGQAEQYK